MWQNSLYLNIFLVFILLSSFTVFYIHKYCRKNQNYSALLLLYFMIGTNIAEYLKHGLVSFSLKLIFEKISFIGIAALPVLWFLAALKMSNHREHINYKTIYLISIIPGSAVILAFTNEFHNLIWKGFYFTDMGPIVLLKDYGIFFWIFVAFSVVISVYALVLVSRSFSKVNYYYNWQRWIVTTVLVISLIVIVLDFLDIAPFSYVSITPILVTFFVAFLIILLDRKRKRVILPIAMNSVVESMKDGVIILNTENEIINFNPSAKKMLNIPSEDIFGEDILQLFPNIEIDEVLNGNNLVDRKDVRIESRGQVFYYDLAFSKIKDFQGNTVGKSVVIRDISQRIKSEEEIKYLGFHDNLTGLYNKSYFEKKIKELDKTVQLPITIIVGGVNGLKAINEAFGHKKGDRLLCDFAKIFKSIIRKGSVVTRWGGDEFAFIFPKTSRDESGKILERIRINITDHKKNDVPMSLALGASTKEYSNENIQDVIVKAENNMFKRKLIEKNSVSSSIIASLERTLFEKSHETEKHAKRMSEFAQKLGKKIGLNENVLNDLSLLSSLHDIGKIAITEEILLKKTKLTEAEWESIKKHPTVGSNIAKATTQIAHISEGILYHHEWWDGSGYPKGLKGENIPIEARIISIVDAYDVMRNGRPYKKKMSEIEAVMELKRCSGTQFDPDLVEIFIDKVLSYKSAEKKVTVG